MDVRIEKSWKKQLKLEFEKPYFGDLVDIVRNSYEKGIVFPPPKEIFHAFDKCPFDDVKVVIIGQDPYHGPGQANGLCFSVAEGTKFPPSLLNIFKEIKTDLDKDIPKSGSLDRWAEQGVLLLNATLTVKAHQAGSHQGKGWEKFTDAVIKLVSEEKENIVFLLWGAYARRKGEVIDRSKHYILESPHPSPLSASRGFFGNKHFSKTNEFLESNEIKPIDW